MKRTRSKSHRDPVERPGAQTCGHGQPPTGPCFCAGTGLPVRNLHFQLQGPLRNLAKTPAGCSNGAMPSGLLQEAAMLSEATALHPDAHESVGHTGAPYIALQHPLHYRQCNVRSAKTCSSRTNQSPSNPLVHAPCYRHVAALTRYAIWMLKHAPLSHAALQSVSTCSLPTCQQFLGIIMHKACHVLGSE